MRYCYIWQNVNEAYTIWHSTLQQFEDCVFWFHGHNWVNISTTNNVTTNLTSSLNLVLLHISHIYVSILMQSVKWTGGAVCGISMLMYSRHWEQHTSEQHIVNNTLWTTHCEQHTDEQHIVNNTLMNITPVNNTQCAAQ